LVPPKTINVEGHGTKNLLADVGAILTRDAAPPTPMKDQAAVNTHQPQPSRIITSLHTVQQAG
jgi:hypothetical protein